MNKKSVEKYLSVIRRACDIIDQIMDDETSQTLKELTKEQVPSIEASKESLYEEQEQQQLSREEIEKHRIARAIHIDELLSIKTWPSSIPQFQCDSKPTEADHVNRANSILDSTLENSVEGANFLDYGTGDGYLASEISLRGTISSTGYDIVPSEVWQKLGNEKVNYTCDVNSLTPQGYDVIFLWDVLDHAIDPIGILSHIKYLSAPKATVHVRTHPWTSRHASHLPKSGNNRAYIHLFLTYEELVEIGFKPLFTRIEKNPLEAYRWWFKDFKVVKENIISDGVNGFFEVPAFKELLASEQQLKPEEIEPFLKMMEIQFVSYQLEA